MIVFKVPDRGDLPDMALMSRAKYQKDLEDELQKWVAKCQEAFKAGFSFGKRKEHGFWDSAFEDWIKERRNAANG